MRLEQDVYQLLRDANVHERLSQNDSPYRVLEGVAAHAILNANTIYWQDQVIEVADNAQLPTRRANGTLRDIDTLVVSSDVQSVHDTKAVLTETVGEDLSVSVFGLKNKALLRTRRAPNMDFVSYRTIDENDGFHIILDGVDTTLTNDWYDVWEVRRTQDDSPLFTTISPVAIEAGYRMRSITGIRPKDKDKLEELRGKLDLENNSNAQVTEAITAKYASQQAVGNAHALAIEEKRGTPRTWFRTRALLLAKLERHPQIVELAQGTLEPLLSPFVGRK